MLGLRGPILNHLGSASWRRFSGRMPRRSFRLLLIDAETALHFFERQLPLWMGVGIGSLAIERKHDQEFRIQARRWDMRGG